MAEIQYTERARKQLQLIFRYVYDAFGSAALIRLEKALFRKLEIVSQTPSAFPIYTVSPETRRVVINAKTLLFYQIEGNKVLITAVKSTYQDFSLEAVT